MEMMNRLPVRSTAMWVVVALCCATFSANTALAQDLNDFGLGGGLDFGGDKKKHVTVAASFEPGKEAGRGTLVLKATIDKGWHIYSTSQKPGGPIATKIKLETSSRFKEDGPIVYSPKPKVKRYDFWPKLDVEEHYGSVTWRVPITIARAAGTDSVTIKGVIDLQMCDPNRCIPTKIPFSTSGK